VPNQFPRMYRSVRMLSIGRTSVVHRREIAMAAAVVGPPMLALLERMISSRLNLNSLPKENEMIMLMKTMIAANRRISGAFWMISGVEGGTLMTVTNMW